MPRVRLRKRALGRVNAMLRPIGFEVVRPVDDFADYIPFERTQVGAKAAGLAVGEYIDREFNVPGSTQDTIDRMAALGVFDRPISRVCEIGPGSGRYLEKVLAACSPQAYEIYETATAWREWLVATYPVTAHPADGRTLAATADGSVDLVHSHKVLNGLKILDACGYLAEIARVTAPGGAVVFDVLTERALDEVTLCRWHESGAGYVTSMMSEQYAVDFFTRRGFTLLGDFLATSMPGKTHYLVFQLERASSC
ncbi:methyltransferase domain-containing protein [Nocardia wallacei]|uniref:methyltransferase domain-containing protein n=2 Tax=Nocardia wallacei TaxID=480035 RepID=UPI00245551DA|nr:methyltransferase domain-containing protein [Nocardia wallacei]